MARPSSPCPYRHSEWIGSIPSLDSVRALLDRTERERTGLFWAEGCRSLFSALERGWQVRQIVYCPKLLKSQSAWNMLRKMGGQLPLLKLSSAEYMELSRRVEPDGIGIVVEQRWQRLIDEGPHRRSLWVALDSIRTPGNLGTILRTCAAVGVQGVMLIGGELDAYDPAVVRASMGAVFASRLIRTSAKALAGWKDRRNVRFIGTSPGASHDYRSVAYDSAIVLMMGSERSGLRERQLALCDDLVKLPMTCEVDSLNLAVATSVMLYAIRG